MDTSSRGEAAALAAEFRAEVAAHEPTWQPDPAWAFRLALAVESLTSGTVVPLMRSAGPSAELAARVTAGSALLADFLHWTAGDTLGTDTAYDWQTWADRLAQHLGWLLGAVSR